MRSKTVHVLGICAGLFSASLVGSQEYGPKEHTGSHCDPCTDGGVDGTLEPCDDWQTISGHTGPGGTGDVDEAFAFDASIGRTYIFSFCEQGGTASHDTGLSVWNATCSGAPLVCDDDTCALLSRLQWTAPATGSFVVRVGGFAGSTGPFTLAYRGVGVTCGGLDVDPDDGLESSGPRGGPFEPLAKNYTITNKESTISLAFSVARTQEWVSLDDGSGPTDGPLTGTLAPQQSVMVAVLIDENANSLPIGTFGATVSFNNVTNGDGDTSRLVDLRVLDPDAAEVFVNGDFETGDLSGWTAVDSGSGGTMINDGTVNPSGPDGPLPPCAGSFGSITTQNGPGVHTLFQEFSLPPEFDILTLSWVDRIRNHAGVFADPIQEFRVEIRDQNDILLREVFSTNPGDPPTTDCTARSVDISEFAGQSIRVAFTEEDNLSFFNLHLDDVSLVLQRSNQPPLADAGADRTLECNSLDGAPVMLDGSGSSDPDSTPGTNDDIVLFEWFEDFATPSETFLGAGETLQVTLPLGLHGITLRVIDSAGEEDTDVVEVIVADTAPPTIALSVEPTTLWPPVHSMEQVDASVVATDACSTPAVVLSSLTSDEPDNAPGTGDGNTTMDIQEANVGAADFQFKLRAEREGTGDGRVYSAAYSATDASGNAAMAGATVFVPHDQNGLIELMSITIVESTQGTTVEWEQVGGALHYNVIRGAVEEIQEAVNLYSMGAVVCIESRSSDTSTLGWEDTAAPLPGQAFFYLVEYSDGRRSGYGTVSAAKPRRPTSGACK